MNGHMGLWIALGRDPAEYASKFSTMTELQQNEFLFNIATDAAKLIQDIKELSKPNWCYVSLERKDWDGIWNSAKIYNKHAH